MGAARFIRDLAVLIGAGRAADSFATAIPSNFDPIVLGGCGRSGTTLLRMMLDSHRRICCGPESSLFRRRAVDTRWLADRFGFGHDEVRAIYDAAASRPAFIEGFAGLCMHKAVKARWAEKTPRNIGRIAGDVPLFSRGPLRARAAGWPRRRLLAADASAPQGREREARANRSQEADRRLRAALGAGH